jgi:glycosyltransferase involved in cell wall biosynthesis
MFFSLIVATLNRTKELNDLFHSLSNQNYTNFEVIVVDQNKHNEVYQICSIFKNKIDIKHFHVNFKGLSRARNYGIKFAKGNIIAFPDDDCIYDTNVLDFVSSFFYNNNVQILTGDTLDLSSKKKYLNTTKNETQISYNNVFNTCISFTIFIRYKSKNDLYFDQELGVGSHFGSAEETDLIINLLKKKYLGIYTPKFIVFHPISRNINIARNYSYALGFGAIHRKHFDLFHIKKNYIFFILISCFKIIFLVKPKLNFSILLGKLNGFIRYKKFDIEQI